MATFVTLVIVPVIYAIFVKDLKLVKWDTTEQPESHGASSSSSTATPSATPAPIEA